MSHIYRKRPQRKGEPFSFTFPPLEIDLADDVVKSSKISLPLNRLAKQLIKQFPTQKGKRVIGVEFSSIQFNFILDTEKGAP